jgi:tetratricopeptide (TPR) repeat protein
MFLPALPFAFGTIAWTGYAERYIYISTAFWIVAIIIYLDGHPPKRYSAACATAGIFVMLMLSYGWQTFNRNLVWQKNVSLFGDTVRQSPKSRRLRDIYMYALYNAGDIPAAKCQYAVGQTLYSLGYDETADLLMAEILNKEGKPNQALELYKTVIRKTRNSSEKALKRIIRHLETMLSQMRDSGRIQELQAKKRTYETQLGELTTDPMVLYNLGQKALAANDRKSALGFFIRAHGAFAGTSPYKVYSAKLIDRLKEEH